MSDLPWSAKFIKYLLFVFNLLFVITGIILIAVGASIHGIYGNYHQFLDQGGYMSTSAFMISIGVIIFFISFFGCCGAVRENYCMTITFTTLLIVVFVFELGAGISGYALRGNTNSLLTHNLNVTMMSYKVNNESALTMDALQKTFQCCGINNYTDWYPVLNDTLLLLPLSCCDLTGVITGVTTNFSCNSESDRLFKDPCLKAFGNEIEAHAVTIGGVAIGIAFIQFLGILFSCHLSRQIKQYQYV